MKKESKKQKIAKRLMAFGSGKKSDLLRGLSHMVKDGRVKEVVSNQARIRRED